MPYAFVLLQGYRLWCVLVQPILRMLVPNSSLFSLD